MGERDDVVMGAGVGDAVSPCGACARGPSRREFFGQLSGAVVAAMLAAELGSVRIGAAPLGEVTGVQVGSSERAYPVPATDGATIDRDAQVILVRFQQHVYAFALACPHENTALRWRAQDARFQCPRHESKYQPDGTFVSGRATRNMDRLPIKRVGNDVVVDVSQVYRSDQQSAQWAAAAVTL